MHDKKQTTMRKILILFYNKLWGVSWENEACASIPDGFELTDDRSRMAEADAVVFHLPDLARCMDGEEIEKRDGQLWVTWNLECDDNYPWVEAPEIRDLFDLRMGYRQQDDVWYPYFSFIRAEAFTRLPPRRPPLDKACLFVSSPFNRSHRFEFLRELMRYTEVDSFGRMLHNKDLPADEGRKTLMEKIADYKFVIGVENALARDYVTEKFFQPLLAGTVPVYRGAPNVEEFAPGRHCFVDARAFRSPADLAGFMNRCYEHPALYDELTAWRTQPLQPGFVQKLEQVKEHPFVRLCRVVEEKIRRIEYKIT